MRAHLDGGPLDGATSEINADPLKNNPLRIAYCAGGSTFRDVCYWPSTAERDGIPVFTYLRDGELV